MSVIMNCHVNGAVPERTAPAHVRTEASCQSHTVMGYLG